MTSDREFAKKLLALDDEKNKPPEQHGPLRWIDREHRCASRGCSSPTFCKLQGVPYCMKHALEHLNELCISLGVLS